MNDNAAPGTAVAFETKILDLMGQGVTITDANGRFLYVNRAYADMLGYAPETLLGKTPFDVTLPEEHATLMLSHALRLTGDANEYETRLKKADGSELWVLIKGVPRMVDDVVIGAVAVITDLSEHKRAEEALRRNEAYYRAILDNADELIYFVNGDGMMFYDTPALERITGYRWDEINALSPEAWLHPDDLNCEGVIFSGLLRQPAGSATFEWRLRAKDGSFRTLETNARRMAQLPHFDGVLAMAHDISDRKQTEQSLLDAETRYRQLVEHINAVVYIDRVDEASSALYMSPQAEALLGYPPEEWIADPDLWLKLIHPDDRQMVIHENARTNASRQPFDLEYRLIAKNGSIVWVHDNATQIEESSGARYWQGFLYDITARKQAEAALAAFPGLPR